MKTSALTCPSCAGTLKFKGSNILPCQYCGNNFLLISPDEVLRFYTETSIDRYKAILIARKKIFEDPAVDPDVRNRANIASVKLFYVPFVLYRGYRIGRVVKTQEIKTMLLLPMHRRETEIVCSDFSFVHPVSRFVQEGIEMMEIPLDTLALKVFEISELAKKAVVFNPDKPLEHYREIFRKDLLGLDPDMEVVEESTLLVYYPVWALNYVYKNDLFSVIIDGIPGEIISARAPYAGSFRVLSMLIFTLVAGVLSGSYCRLILSLFNSRIPGPVAGFMLIVLSGIGFFLVWFELLILAKVWNRFRFSGEVFFKKGMKEIRRISQPRETYLEKIAGKLTDYIYEMMLERANERSMISIMSIIQK